MGRLLAVPAVVLALAVAASSAKKDQKGQSSAKTQGDKAGKKASSGDKSDKAGKKASSGDTGVPECRKSSFQCGSGEKAVPKEGFVPMSYGCLEIPQLDKCCVQRDVCMRTCGMHAKTCFTNWVACAKGVCGKDSTCRQNAKTLGKSTGGKDDQELCETYAQGQQMACDCASQYVWKSQLNSRLVDFYKKHQPDRLDAKGGLLNADRVWDKWDGNESALFLALSMKYWETAVDLKAKSGQSSEGARRERFGSARRRNPQAAGGDAPEKSGKGRGDARAPRRGAVEERVREWPRQGDEGGAAPGRATGGGPPEGAGDGPLGAGGGLEDNGRLELLERQMREAAQRGDFGAAKVLKSEVQGLRTRELERLGAELERLEGLDLELELERALARVEEVRAAQAELPRTLARAEEIRAARHRLQEKLGMPVDGAEAHAGADGAGEEPDAGSAEENESGREDAGGAGRVYSEL